MDHIPDVATHQIIAAIMKRNSHCQEKDKKSARALLDKETRRLEYGKRVASMNDIPNEMICKNKQHDL